MDIGGGINYERAYILKPNNYTALAGDKVVMDNTLSAATLILPLAPLDGQWVDVSGAGLYSTYPVYVEGTSRNIMIVGDKNMELDEDKVGYRFWWDFGNLLWKVRKIDIEGEVATYM